MIQLSTAIWISIGLIVYYLIFQVFSDFVRAGMKSNASNALIAKLSLDYNVNIRTFQKNNSLYGFAWFRSIWINENLFRNKKTLLFTFHHEYFHYKHHHKQWTLFVRFLFSLVPISLAFISWWLFVIIFLNLAVAIHYLNEYFESTANEYAREKGTSTDK